MMKKNLLIIDTAPELSTSEIYLPVISQLHNNDMGLTMYFIDQGVLWLSDDFWKDIRFPDIVYYANAIDMSRFKVSFQSGVVFSSKGTLSQLIETAETVSYASQLLNMTQMP